MDTQPLTLTELAGAIARSRRMLAIAVFVGLALGAAVGIAMPRTFSATATVRVDPTGVDPLMAADVRVDMTAEQRIVRSTQIVGRRDITATVVSDSRVLLVRARAGTPAAAARDATWVAQHYLAERSHDAEERVDQLQHVLARQADERATRGIAQQIDLDLARARRLVTSGGSILETASIPSEPDQPSWLLSGLAGGLLALITSVPFAAGRGRLKTRDGRWVVLDLDAGMSEGLREGVSAYADEVLVIRDRRTDLTEAKQWCERLRSIGVAAEIVGVDPDNQDFS